MIFAFDVIHGYRTVFPIPLGEAASWDPRAASESAAIAAAEAKAAGLHWTFAPMVDIARDARWGRSRKAPAKIRISARPWPRARVRGFQGTTTAGPRRSSPAPSTGSRTAPPKGARLQHGRMSERTLRNVYFRRSRRPSTPASARK